MGFLDFLFGTTQCPSCGTKGARKSDIQIRCPNPSCPYFDPTLGGRGVPGMAGSWSTRRADYSPLRPLDIRYRNFRGEEKTFTTDADSLKKKRNHIVARVKPTGEPITLSRDRIQNLQEVERALPQKDQPGQPQPTARERQVLGYHKKHKTTSPLYESIRAKYTNW